MTGMVFYSGSFMGKRMYNEDVIKMTLNLTGIDSDKAKVNLVILCDGHSAGGKGDGKTVATFVSEKLTEYLMDKTMTYPINKRTIDSVYTRVNNDLVEKHKKISHDSGSTALVIVIYGQRRNYEMQVINLGDCRAVLYNGFAIPLSIDHKPEWPQERKRINMLIEKTGIDIKIEKDNFNVWRIMGQSVTRSFGDIECAPFVTHIPEAFNRKITSDDEFVIIGCDGIWDVMENHDAVTFVKDHFDGNGYIYDTIKNDNIAIKLANYAIKNDTNDNSSVIIIRFVN